MLCCVCVCVCHDVIYSVFEPVFLSGLFSVFQPEVLEQIHNLKELWLDNNSLQTIPGVNTKQPFT